MEAGKKFGFRLIRCKELSFESAPVSVKAIPADAVSFQYGFRIMPFEKKGVSLIVTGIILVDGVQVFKLASEFVFEITPMEGVIELMPDGRLQDHANIVPTLFGIAYSTLRGMLAVRTAGTPLEKYPLPIIDAYDAVKRMQASLASK